LNVAGRRTFIAPVAVPDVVVRDAPADVVDAAEVVVGEAVADFAAPPHAVKRTIATVSARSARALTFAG
jgi:hypothetical protein